MIPRWAWFDQSRKPFKVLSPHEPRDVLPRSGDVPFGVDGQPVAHTHRVLARAISLGEPPIVPPSRRAFLGSEGRSPQKIRCESSQILAGKLDLGPDLVEHRGAQAQRIDVVRTSTAEEHRGGR
jgi:hypothetical protein